MPTETFGIDIEFPRPVYLPKATKGDDPRIMELVKLANERIRTFAVSNPYWARRSFIRISWRGREYRAVCSYSSDQGTGRIDTVRLPCSD